MELFNDNNQRKLTLIGALDKTNFNILKRKLDKISAPMINIVLDLSSVYKMEPQISYQFLKIFIRAIHDNIKITIICKGNKQVCQAMKETNSYYIFNQAGVLK